MPRGRRGRAVGALPFLFATVALVDPAAAQDPSGRAVGVIPDASALRTDGRRPLAVQQPVYMGDRIQTGSSGEAQILFIDDTRLVVGAGSSLLIDSSVMRNRRTMSSFVVSALRGSFRFISGTSPKPAYAIRTPTATIGIRGTQFDFAILPNGGTEFVLFQGQAQVCDRSGSCVWAQRACSAVSVPPVGPPRLVMDREERNARLRAYFPYVREQRGSLRREFRTDTGSCGNIAAVQPPPGMDLRPGAVPAAIGRPGVTPTTPVTPRDPPPRDPVVPRDPASPPDPVTPRDPGPTTATPDTPNSPPGIKDTPDDRGGPRGGGPGNGNGNTGNRGNGGGNTHGSGPGTGNNGTNNGQGLGASNGGGGFGNGGTSTGGRGGSDGRGKGDTAGLSGDADNGGRGGGRGGRGDRGDRGDGDKGGGGGNRGGGNDK